MAKLFTYEQVVTGASLNFARNNRPKVRKALIKKGLTDNMVDDFLDEVENCRALRNAMQDLLIVRNDAQGKFLGAKALMNARNPVSNKLFGQIVGKQLQLKFKDVFLEIHKKGSNLQLWYHAKGGKSQVLLDHKSTRV